MNRFQVFPMIQAASKIGSQYFLCGEDLVKFAFIVAEAEREKCAKICDEFDDYTAENKADMCAEMIRARGQHE
jgi:hypothetical protein